MSDNDQCICSRLAVGGKLTDSRNWNPECLVHPWNEQMQAQANDSVSWQRAASKVRELRAENLRLRAELDALRTAAQGIFDCYKPDDFDARKQSAWVALAAVLEGVSDES